MANRIGQLRPYSYTDLLLLLAAAGASAPEFVTCSGLWFGFLIFLEWVHRDEKRAPWPWWGWALPWLGVAAYVHTVSVLPFLLLSVLYALKKQFAILALISPILNGALKGTLLLLVPSVTTQFAAGVGVACGVRNLFGDFRDVEKDRRQQVHTIPVRLGLQRDVKWLYPVGLAATTLAWVIAGPLPWWTVLVAWFVEWQTYRLTPR